MSGPHVKRFEEQRWLLDAVIRTVGIEWDQARIASKSRPLGAELETEMRAVARRIRKYDDIHREFAAQASRRQERAARLEAEDRRVSACESWLAASLLWSTACWPLHGDSPRLRAYEEHVNVCYAGFMRHAPHPVVRCEIPMGTKSMPAYLHLPAEPRPGTRFPCVVIVGGMDSSKENMVALYGDKFLTRGFAVLAPDGPGQAEAITRGLLFTPDNFGDAAEAWLAWLGRHPAIDPDRIVFRGTSFGSYFGTVAAAAAGNRIRGFAATGVCQEPGCHTIFNVACPTFKARFMMMSGYDDEALFDAFCAGIDLRRFAPRLAAPYMVIAGESDQLSPIEYTEELFGLITAPKRLVVYEGANHGVGDAPSAANGEEKVALLADWLLDRIAGKPMTSERVWVDSSGRASAKPF